MAEDYSYPEETMQVQRRTLDDSSQLQRGLGHSTILSVVRQTHSVSFSPLYAFLVVGVLLGITLYVGWLVRASVRENMRDSLGTVLKANATALELWLAEQRDSVSFLASDETVRSFALSMIKDDARHHSLESAGAEEKTGGRQTDQNGDREPVIPRTLDRHSQRMIASGYLGWAVLDPLGIILAASDPRFNGCRVPMDHETSDRLTSGEVTVTRPFPMEGVREQSGESAGPIAVMCAIAPIREDLRALGAVVLIIDPAEQFTGILTVAQMGDSGETYAFDRDAVLISRSRFDDQLKSAGLLRPDQSSPLRVHIRNPGVDLRSTEPAENDPRMWPMTRMADSATRGGSGSDVVGYNDYRGVEVVGAWQWLPEYDIGLATEMEVDEAYRSLRILATSFIALLGTVVITGGSLVALSWINRPGGSRGERIEELNRRLGQYQLRQRIGKGGMGTVYLGAHGLLDRKVAIKVLENTDATDRSLARFQREVQLSARLKHPNTIEIYDFGRTDEGTFFYVMEFVDGISLEQLVGYYGRQPAERVIYILLQICGSIAEAHAVGMVHRDIKPANVLLTSRSGIHDLVKVLDFGLAKQIDHDSMQLTRTDSLTGTPLYMSPEAIRDAAAADVLSDIYSIGAVGYTLLSGCAPFDGETSADICAKKLHDEPELPQSRVGVSLAKDIQDVLIRCLHLDVSERPQSAGELAQELLACNDSPHWTQQDAALWWREVFDGPYLDEFEFNEEQPSKDGTRGDTAVNDMRPDLNARPPSTATGLPRIERP